MSLFKKKPQVLYAPVCGSVVRLEDVSDEVFSKGFLGKGIAINPSAGAITAPCDGTVVMVADTNHAVNILSSDGTEVLIHVGIDTVKLNGQGFTVSVKDGQSIKVGDALLSCDIASVSAAGFDTVVIMTVCNTDDYKSVEQVPSNGDAVNAGEAAISCRK